MEHYLQRKQLLDRLHPHLHCPPRTAEGPPPKRALGKIGFNSGGFAHRPVGGLEETDAERERACLETSLLI